VHDDTGGCDFDAVMVSSTTTTATLGPMPIPGIASPNTTFRAPCGVAAGNLTLSWGTTLFQASDVGRSIDIPFAGTAGVGDQPASSSVQVIATVADPFSATLTGTTTASVAGAQAGRIIIGTDDTAADDLFALAVYNNNWRVGYWPPNWNSFEASPTATNVGNLQNIIRSGEGGILWPESAPQYTFVGAPAGAPAVVAPRDAIARDSLRNMIAQTGTRVLVEVGDSMLADGQNGLGVQGSLGVEYANYVKQKTGFPVTRYQYAIGGANALQYDPNGPNFGNGVGVPGLACGSRPAFYTASCSTQWMTFVENVHPDLIVYDWAGNENYNADLASYENIIQVTQAAAWQTTTGRYPDIAWIPTYNSALQGGTQSITSDSAGEYVTKGFRSLFHSRAPQTALANGGTVHYFDLSRIRDIVMFGFDPQFEPNQNGQCARAVTVAGIGLTANTPYTIPCQVDGGWGITLHNQQSGVLSAYDLWNNAVSGGLCFLVSNGSVGTPQSLGIQTGASTIGYPGGTFCAYVDSGTGHWFVKAYLYNFSQSAVLTLSNTSKTLTSTTALVNHGHGLASIAISGAGNCATALPAGETIAVGGVSSDGKTITLATNSTNSLSSTTCTVQIYQLLFGPTDTGVTATVATTNPTTQNVIFEIRGDQAYFVEVNPASGTVTTDIWTGTLFGFGGMYYPVITAIDGAAHANNDITITSQVWVGRPEAARLPQLATATELWGPCGPSSIVVGPFGGQCFAHESTLGAFLVHDQLFKTADWALGPPAMIQAAPLTSGATASVACGTVQPINQASPMTITLPAYCLPTMPVWIKDSGGHGAADNITIQLSSGNIDGAATQVISSNFGFAQVGWTTTGVAGLQ